MQTADRSFLFSDEGIRTIETDSRKEMRDGLFVPVIGERNDGHDFIGMAVQNGARAVLTSRPAAPLREAYPDVRFYEVQDTVMALQEIGLMERRKFHGPVIGVTGSVGKTTTRNMIACALGAGRQVFQTAGNQNSQIGVPITMFHMARSGMDAAVIELGMSEPGEMTRIASVACVDAAVITNIGIAHIENLGSQENILREKLHILDGMRDGGTLLLNGDDPILGSLTEDRIHSFGIACGKEIRLAFYRSTDYDLELQVPGRHMQENACAAMHAAELFSVDPASAREALRSFTGLRGRGEQFRTKGGVTVIDDSYNASPVSMKAGIEVLSAASGGRRIAVLGDMLELGEKAAEYHYEVGQFLSAHPAELVFLYGKLAEEIGRGLRDGSVETVPEVRFFSDLQSLREAVLSELREGDTVLFKGSNSMRLSEIVKQLRDEVQDH